jgi:hypothetical protein
MLIGRGSSRKEVQPTTAIYYHTADCQINNLLHCINGTSGRFLRRDFAILLLYLKLRV